MRRENAVISAGSLFRAIVLRHIIAEQNDPAEMKARLLIAREHGHLDDEVVEDIFIFYGLADA